MIEKETEGSELKRAMEISKEDQEVHQAVEPVQNVLGPVEGQGKRRSLEFECAMCNAQFGFKSILNEHIAFVHEVRKPFQCHKCGAKFDGLSDMTFHVESKHEQRRYEGKKWFECEICRERYDYKA